MSKDVSKAEVQLCMASRNIPQRPFTPDQLRAFGAMAFKGDLVADWSNEFKHLCDLGVFRAEGDRFGLTEQGEVYTERIVASEFFGRMMLRAEQSKAYATFCERVYGKNLTQFGTADMDQLERLVAGLDLSEQSHVLDVGCGIGATTEYLSLITGAQFTGVDLAEPAIERASERTKNLLGHVRFAVANIGELDLPDSFDAVIAVDTLYFAKNLSRTVGRMKALMKPGGRMALFMSEFLAPGGSAQDMEPPQTRLGRALTENELAFETHDFTDSNLQFWRRSMQVAQEMKDQFEAEGNKDLCEGRIAEGGAVLAMAESGKMARYLYFVH